MKYPLKINTNAFYTGKASVLLLWSKGHHSRDSFLAAIESDEEASEDLFWNCKTNVERLRERGYWPCTSYWRCARDFRTGELYYTQCAPRRGAFPVTEMEVKYASLGT